MIRIELLKLQTMRTTYGLLGIAVALTALDAVLRGSRAGVNKRPPLDTATGLTQQLTITGFGLLMAAVLGAIVASGEFRHATATYTYLAVPQRGRVLLAKAVTAALAGLVFGAVTAGVTIGVGLAFVAGHGYPVVLGAGTIARYAVGTTVGAAVLGVVGVGVGSLVRSQLATVLGVLVWSFFVEAITGGFFNWIGPYLPFTATTTLGGSPLGGGGFGFAGDSSASALPFAAALAIVAGAAVLLNAVSARTTVRADIS